MSLTRVPVLTCDGIGCGATVWQLDLLGAGELREAALRKGWERFDGRDWCRVHAQILGIETRR